MYDILEFFPRHFIDKMMIPENQINLDKPVNIYSDDIGTVKYIVDDDKIIIISIEVKQGKSY